mgnify:CR=1 FL=1
MTNEKVFLQHPIWGSPRAFNPEHAANILELEKIHPSGITAVAEDSSVKQNSDAANNSRNSGDSDAKTKRGKKRDTKSSKSGK